MCACVRSLGPEFSCSQAFVAKHLLCGTRTKAKRLHKQYLSTSPVLIRTHGGRMDLHSSSASCAGLHWMPHCIGMAQTLPPHHGSTRAPFAHPELCVCVQRPFVRSLGGTCAHRGLGRVPSGKCARHSLRSTGPWARWKPGPSYVALTSWPGVCPARRAPSASSKRSQGSRHPGL